MMQQHRVGAAAPTRRRSAQRRSEAMWGWLFILPLLVGVGLFYLYPIGQNFYMSLTKPSVFGNSSKFVGLANYEKAFADGNLSTAFRNTFIYTGILLLGIPIAVVMASLINRPKLAGSKLYRLAFFMPYLAMPTAIALVWRIIYNGDYGVLNWVLREFGMERPPYWTSSATTAIFAVSIVALWASIGYAMIILFAGLQGIPRDLYEAAEIDGAGKWAQFTKITVPLLSPSIFFLLVMQAIAGFQAFDLLFAVMGQNNPAMPQTQTLVYLFYKEAFVVNHKGYAAAIATIILAVVAVLTAIQFSVQRKWVNYLD